MEDGSNPTYDYHDSDDEVEERKNEDLLNSRNREAKTSLAGQASSAAASHSGGLDNSAKQPLLTDKNQRWDCTSEYFDKVDFTL